MRPPWLLWLLAGCADRDHDGYPASQDCAEKDLDVHPGATEVCNGTDDDCDGHVDEDVGDPVWPDTDGDGYGDRTAETLACDVADGFAGQGGDCDDADPSVHPGVDEICDLTDQDCDDLVDEDPNPTLYEDLDADGYGNPDRPLDNCDAWAADNDDDCDDDDPDRSPAAQEVCNGVDDDCDDLVDDGDPSVLLQNWYTDGDGDGWGTGAALPDAGCVAPKTAPDAAPVDGDCDDANATRHPDAPDVCNGQDDDCDLAAEGSDAWAFPDLGVRVPVDVTPPAGPAGPWVIDLDAAAALAAVGDTSVFDPASVRAAVHDCGGSFGTTELPVAFLDHQSGLHVLGSDDDDLGDGHGDAVVLWDLDGTSATVEPAPAGTVEIGLYFQGAAPPSAWISDLVVSVDELEAGGAVATFDAAQGGVLEAFVLPGSPLLASQATAEHGNGVRTTASPLSAQDVAATVTLLDSGPVTAAVRSEGHLDDAEGAFDFTYTYRVFAGRPELWITTHFLTTEPTEIVGDPDRTVVMRPFESAWDLVGATCTTDPALLWADASTDDWGLTWAWVVPSVFVTHLECTDVSTWTSANDYKPCCYDTVGTILDNTSWVDHSVLVLLPHEGDITTIEDTRLARTTAPVIVVDTAQVP
jgi:hypothetical protein